MAMNNTLSRVFTAIGTNPRSTQNQDFPMLNSVVTNFSSFLSSTGQLRKKKALMAQYYSIPELTGMVNKVARDIVSDYEFIPIRKGRLGRADKKRAEEFSETQFIDKTRFSQVVDSLITGEAFGFMKSSITKSEKERIDKVVEQKINQNYLHIDYKERLEIKAMIEEKLDEDLRLPKEYINVASSTMEVRNDQYEILGYTQWVNSRPEEFSHEEIIRFNLMDIDGRVQGFTPVESMITQLEILKQMWDNQLALQKNGGVFDRVIIAKNLQPNSTSYQKIREQLTKYKHVQNRHGNLLFTGDIDIKNVEQMDQMQFKDAGLYITGIMALQWSVPRSSIPIMMGGANTKDDSGGNSERDYWNNVEFMQQLWANTENTQMWIDKFKVRIKFKRKFKQSMIQEETYNQMRYNNVQLMNDMFRLNGKTLNTEKLMEEFKVNDSDLEDYSEPVEEVQEPKSTLNNQPSQSDSMDSDDKKVKKTKKREEQFNLASNNGVPSGATKEKKELEFKTWSKDVELEFKQLLSGNLMKVDFEQFVKIYNEDKQMGIDPPRLFVRMKDDFVNFNFKSTDYSYTTTITMEEFNTDSMKIQIMNLKGKFYEV